MHEESQIVATELHIWKHADRYAHQWENLCARHLWDIHNINRFVGCVPCCMAVYRVDSKGFRHMYGVFLEEMM